MRTTGKGVEPRSRPRLEPERSTIAIGRAGGRVTSVRASYRCSIGCTSTGKPHRRAALRSILKTADTVTMAMECKVAPTQPMADGMGHMRCSLPQKLTLVAKPATSTSVHASRRRKSERINTAGRLLLKSNARRGDLIRSGAPTGCRRSVVPSRPPIVVSSTADGSARGVAGPRARRRSSTP